ncbi:MAG: metallophosphoesterase [Pseudomonadota bacterium]
MTFVLGLGAVLLALFMYAAWIEPAMRLRVQRYDIALPGWGARAPVTLVLIADLHAGAPQVSLRRVRRIVRQSNSLGADVAVLLGDYAADHALVWSSYTKREIIAELAHLRAPLGTFAVLGNHDWWQDPEAARTARLPEAATALEAEGISLLENAAVPLRDGADRFWLAGLADQRPLSLDPAEDGFDDIDLAMAEVPADCPAILLAHEPDIFPDIPARALLTLSGHTHGGQVRIGRWSPVIMAAETERYAYGVYEHGAQRLVVSGGLGCSDVPLRLGMPPEITLVTLRGTGGEDL